MESFKYSQWIKVVGLALAMSAASACTKKDGTGGGGNTTDDANVPQVSNLLIEMPTAVSKAQGSNTGRLAYLKKTNPLRYALELTHQLDEETQEEGSPAQIYDGIREIVGLADAINDSVKEILEAIPGENRPEGFELEDITEEEPFIYSNSAIAGGPHGVKIARNAEDGDYEYTMTLYWLNEDEEFAPGVIFNFSLTDSDSGKGEIYFIGAAVEQDADTVLKVTYDTESTAGHTMTVEISGMSDGGEAPENGVLTVAKKDGILSLAGNFYFGSFGANSNGMFDGSARNYIFVGKVDLEANKAMMSVALPPSDDTDTSGEIFNAYSVGSVFQAGFVNIIGDDDGTNNQACCCNVGGVFGLADANVCTEAMTATGCTCAARTQSIETIIAGVQTTCESDNPGFAAPVCAGNTYIFNMSNPAYFDADGFVGTADFNTPESGYEDLSPEDIEYRSAADVADLTISVDTTAVSEIE